MSYYTFCVNWVYSVYKMYYELIWNIGNYSIHTRSTCMRELREIVNDTEQVPMAIYYVPWCIVVYMYNLLLYNLLHVVQND